MNELFAALSEPFPREAIDWRVGATNADKDKGIALAYIQARPVMDRLDEVVGVGNWTDTYTPIQDKNGVVGFLCTLSLRIDGEWVAKTDGADTSDIESIKGGISDAFKRAAVKWGIGRYLYDLPTVWLPIEARGGSFVLKEKPKLPSWALPKNNAEPRPMPVKTREEKPDAKPAESLPISETMTIEDACKIETSDDPPRRYGDLTISELSVRFNELSKQLKDSGLDPAERAVKERKLKAAKMVIDAKRNKEF